MRREGRVGGHRLKLIKRQQEEIISLVVSGQKTGAEAAKLFCVHPSIYYTIFGKVYEYEMM